MFIFSFIFMQCLHYLVFDPGIYKFFYYWAYPDHLTYSTITFIYSLLHTFSVIVTYFILLYSLLSLTRYLLKTPSFREVSLLTFATFIIYFILFILYLLVFWWAPTNLIHVNKIAQNERFLSIPKVKVLLTYDTIAVLETLCLTVIFVCIIFHGIFLKNIMNDKKNLARNVNTTSVISSCFSHYMKNEILEIIAEIDLLEDQGADAPESVAFTLGQIRKNCINISERLQVLNSSTKISTLHLTNIMLSDLINNALKKKAAKLNDITVIVDISIEYIMVDKFYFSEVLNNILSNSIEAFENTNCKNKYIHITAKDFEEWAIITFIDNGPGIGKEELKTIFEPYKSSKSSKTNWGLGLFVCKRIITAHDGNIKINSHLGSGTIVTITLPFTKENINRRNSYE